jgi:hypothetical protein
MTGRCAKKRAGTEPANADTRTSQMAALPAVAAMPALQAPAASAWYDQRAYTGAVPPVPARHDAGDLADTQAKRARLSLEQPWAEPLRSRDSISLQGCAYAFATTPDRHVQQAPAADALAISRAGCPPTPHLSCSISCNCRPRRCADCPAQEVLALGLTRERISRERNCRNLPSSTAPCRLLAARKRTGRDCWCASDAHAWSLSES